MAIRIPINETALRRAMGTETYRQSGHPERQAFSDWVRNGFSAVFPADRPGSSGGTVFVRAYTRRQDGKPVQVSAHQRSGRPRQALPGSPSRRGEIEASPQAPPVVLAQGIMPWLMPRAPTLFARPPVTPGGPRVPMQRVPRQSGKESARDTPDWARGNPRYVGENPSQYAERLLDRHYGSRSAWDRVPADRGPTSEFLRIQKFGQRAFRDPRSILPAPDA